MSDEKTMKEMSAEVAKRMREKRFNNFLADKTHNVPKTVYDKPAPEKEPEAKRGR